MKSHSSGFRSDSDARYTVILIEIPNRTNALPISADFVYFTNFFYTKTNVIPVRICVRDYDIMLHPELTFD